MEVQIFLEESSSNLFQVIKFPNLFLCKRCDGVKYCMEPTNKKIYFEKPTHFNGFPVCSVHTEELGSRAKLIYTHKIDNL